MRLVLVSFSILLSNAGAARAQADYAAPILAGLTNHGKTADKPYVTAGTRAYVIGTQDGDFPDLGQHLRGEMGGAWLHPIKLIDGFWATVTEPATGRDTALATGTDFITYPYGNRFTYGQVLDSLAVERFQFSPDGREGFVVQYVLRNPTRRRRALTFQFGVKTDLRPVWFSDRLGITDARDTVAWEPMDRIFVARDTGQPWFCVWGATGSTEARPVADPPAIGTSGSGVTAASRHTVAVGPRSTATLTFVVAGSASSRGAAVETWRALARQHASLLAEKKRHYESLLRQARVTIPDRRLQEVYNWVKVNTDWLVRDVPGIGRGLGGGLMEYPWWFGTDASYSLQAMLATGNAELARQTLRLLRDHSRKANGNGRIVHEVTTNGGIVNPGNTQETAQFIMAVGKVVDWTGDLAFAREMYPALKLGLRWLLTDMDQNHNLFPEGYGIMEVSGLNAELIDVAVYTQQALEVTAHRPRPRRARHRHGLRAAGSGTEGPDQRPLLGRGRGLVRGLLRNADAGIQRRGGGDPADSAQGGQRAHPERPRAHRILRGARAAVLDAAGQQPRLDHQQELGHLDADGGRHRSARAGDPAAGQDPPRERRRLRTLPVRGRAAGDDDHLDRGAGGR